MINNVYLVEHCTRKDAQIRSSTGIGAGLGEHLALMERSNKIPIRDQGGFGAWFANRMIVVEATVSAWWALCVSWYPNHVSPLESDLGKSMSLPLSLEKLPEYFLVEVEGFEPESLEDSGSKGALGGQHTHVFTGIETTDYQDVGVVTANVFAVGNSKGAEFDAGVVRNNNRTETEGKKGSHETMEEVIAGNQHKGSLSSVDASPMYATVVDSVNKPDVYRCV
nr:hypothetical protein [Tanacetum cinerariifolium]